MLEVVDLTIAHGARVLLDAASFRIAAGENVALIGRNGAGKTTLLRTLAGEFMAEGGQIIRPPRYGWLRQDLPASAYDKGALTFEVLLTASPLWDDHQRLDQLRLAMSDPEVIADGDRLEKAINAFTNAETRFGEEGGYELEANAERIAHGVGLKDEDLLQEASILSGGQRRRLEIARLLLAQHELLILDEPTNHLDADAKRWVMDFLTDTKSTVLVVSHDIELMDKSIDRVLVLENATIDAYRGTYSSYLTQRAEREEQRDREAHNRDREVKRIEKTLDMFQKGNATHAQKRRSLNKRLEAVERKFGPVELKVKKRTLNVKFPTPTRAGDIVLEVHGLAKGFEKKKVWNNINFTIGRGERWLILGRNGAGKTTLLRTIAGIYQPEAGELRFGAGVHASMYAQEHEDLQVDKSVFWHLEQANKGTATHKPLEDSELRAMLGVFGLTGAVANQEAGTLSGGEKTKLGLCRLIIQRANFLLLDEPTNNLDPASREAILAALQNYKGTFGIVTHDTEFAIQIQPTHALIVPTGEVRPFDEDLLDTIETR
jgi:ATP-binding cassette subfamily F protein 3